MQTRAQQMVATVEKHFPVSASKVTTQRFGVRARQVLIMRYIHDMTLEQVGQALGITRERVRQIESKALRLIRAKPGMMEKVRDALAEDNA